VLRVKLPHLARWTSRRRENAVRYDALFAEAGLTDRITLPAAPADRRHIFNQYVVRVPERDRVRAALSDRGIGTEIYYPVPFHLQECFAPLGYQRGDFPQAEAAAASTLALPIYGELTAEQQAAVVAALADALR
jgi:dTDP-4-amino-4,6-dideoxygalactose transaminase